MRGHFTRLIAGLAVSAALAAGMTTARAEDTQPTPEQIEEARTFTVNNAIFILFHEAGHMLISEFGLPVLGREEDAVDALSSILMLESDSDEFDKAIQDSADGWFLLDESKEEIGDSDFLDTHALDRQRAYQIVCMMTGADAEYFKKFADSLDFPDSRREECAYEYERTKQSWFGLLQPHLRESGKAKITVSYQPAGDEALQPFADILKEAQVLEVVADSFSEIYKLDDGIRFTGKACGEPNAYWHPEEREITFCYEMALQHVVLIDGFFERERQEKKNKKK